MKGIYLVLLLVLIISCNNPIAITPGSGGKNIVTGISITSETSPDVIAVWGTPNTNYPDPPEVTPENIDCNEEYECPDLPSSFGFFNPYPNPADGNINATFSLPVSSKVSLWVETAYWVAENENLPFRVNRPFQVFNYIDDQELDAGSYSSTMDIKSMCSGGEAYPGFYRVFIKTSNGFLSWRDIYIYGPKGTNPPGLGEYVFYDKGCQLDLNFD